MFVCLSVYLSVCLFVCLSVCLFVCLSVCLSVGAMFVWECLKTEGQVRCCFKQFGLRATRLFLSASGHVYGRLHVWQLLCPRLKRQLGGDDAGLLLPGHLPSLPTLLLLSPVFTLLPSLSLLSLPIHTRSFHNTNQTSSPTKAPTTTD